MKPILLVPIVLLAGTGVGGAAAFATVRMIAPHPIAKPAPVAVETSFVPVLQVLAPLVLGDGRLAGYVRFDASLEVSADDAAATTERLPLLLHAINMRTYRTPLAAGPDGMLPDIAAVRAVVNAAATEVFGRDRVRRIAITKAEPA